MKQISVFQIYPKYVLVDIHPQLAQLDFARSGCQLVADGFLDWLYSPENQKKEISEQLLCIALNTYLPLHSNFSIVMPFEKYDNTVRGYEI